MFEHPGGCEDAIVVHVGRSGQYRASRHPRAAAIIRKAPWFKQTVIVRLERCAGTRHLLAELAGNLGGHPCHPGYVHFHGLLKPRRVSGFVKQPVASHPPRKRVVEAWPLCSVSTQPEPSLAANEDCRQC
jgi:hypothetical protein